MMMSAYEVRKQIEEVQRAITSPLSVNFNPKTGKVEINSYFLEKVNLLLNKYGAFVGKSKAKHLDYSKEMDQMDEIVGRYFEYLVQSSEAKYCFNLVTLGIGKISKLLSFVEGLEAYPPEKKVSKQAYEKLKRENEANKKALELLVKYKGLPELKELLEKARNVKLLIDEHWVLALCSANLIEAIVNKKLEELELSTNGSFEKKYRRLAKAIKEKEKRDIQELLPLALYKGVRNKLDHASFKVTPKEAKDISNFVINLISEIFQ